MTPQKNLLPGFAMAITLWSITLLPSTSVAQTCSGTMQTITYDTVIYGGGSQSYSLPLPKYYSTAGYTLLSASIDAYLTTTATTQFQNTNGASVSFNPNLSRGDEVDFNGGYLTSGNTSYNFAHASIAAGATKFYSPATVFNNVNIIDYTIDNSDPTLNSFQGLSTLDLNYTSATFINNVSFGVVPTSTASDNISFSITYTFCNPVILSSNFLTFAARRQDIQSIALSWTIGNETIGRRYDIEVSPDGDKYTYYKSLSSISAGGNANYVYGYYIAPGSQGKLYFRLKQVEQDGSATYSPVRMIDLNAEGRSRAFMIYPNPPTDHINVVFPAGGGGWQVDILSSDGALVQRGFFDGMGTGRMSFSHKLAAGTYFVRGTNQQTSESHSGSFIMH